MVEESAMLNFSYYMVSKKKLFDALTAVLFHGIRYVSAHSGKTSEIGKQLIDCNIPINTAV